MYDVIRESPRDPRMEDILYKGLYQRSALQRQIFNPTSQKAALSITTT